MSENISFEQLAAIIADTKRQLQKDHDKWLENNVFSSGGTYKSITRSPHSWWKSQISLTGEYNTKPNVVEEDVQDVEFE